MIQNVQEVVFAETSPGNEEELDNSLSSGLRNYIRLK
jgi:hypothetical protein